MVTTDVDTLSGVALDEAIHLEVMGGSEDDLRRQVSGRTYVTCEMAMDAGNPELEGSLDTDEEWERVAPPPYSSAWDGYGAVVNRLNTKEPEGYDADLRVESCGLLWFPDVYDGPDVGHFLARVGVRLRGQKRHRWGCSHKSLMEAGCRAALKAVRSRKVTTNG